ncbi:MAG: hypothetical protein ABIR87_03790 [Sphingomicrobium sp.]
MLALASKIAPDRATPILLFVAGGKGKAVEKGVILEILDLSRTVDVATYFGSNQTESGCQIRKLGGSSSGP